MQCSVCCMIEQEKASVDAPEGEKEIGRREGSSGSPWWSESSGDVRREAKLWRAESRSPAALCWNWGRGIREASRGFYRRFSLERGLGFRAESDGRGQ
jgi:hypothetical protein